MVFILRGMLKVTIGLSLVYFGMIIYLPILHYYGSLHDVDWFHYWAPYFSLVIPVFWGLVVVAYGGRDIGIVLDRRMKKRANEEVK